MHGRGWKFFYYIILMSLKMPLRQYLLNIKSSKVLKDILQKQCQRYNILYYVYKVELDSQKVHRTYIEIMLIPTEYETKWSSTRWKEVLNAKVTMDGKCCKKPFRYKIGIHIIERDAWLREWGKTFMNHKLQKIDHEGMPVI